MENMGVGTQSSGPGLDQAKHLADVARERAVKEVDKRMGPASERLSHFASKLEEAFDEGSSPTEQRIARQAAQVVRRVSSRIEGKSTEELLSDASRQMRQHPGLLMAGFAALGFIGGRLLRT